MLAACRLPLAGMLPAVRTLRYGLTCLCCAAFAVSAFSACEPPFETWAARESVAVRHAKLTKPVPPTGRLKVMTWNIKFAGGRIDFWFDLWGDRVQMTTAEVSTHLEQVAALIREVDPDILLVQEIEVNSRRSAYADMVRVLLEKTSLNHAAYFSTWKSRYVPTQGLGRIDMGNAIFAKHPIVEAERIALADRMDQDPATSAFYLHRALGRVLLDVGARPVAAYVVHTEAYDTDGTKSKQLRQIQSELAKEQHAFVIGGDFNAIPPGSLHVVAFNDEHPDSQRTEFAQPPYDLGDMGRFYQSYLPAITLERYGTTLDAQKVHFTHSVIGPDKTGVLGQPGFWNRKLDYLFLKPPSQWAEGSTDTLQTMGRQGITAEPVSLSDHCPIVGVWQVEP